MVDSASRLGSIGGKSIDGERVSVRDERHDDADT